MVKIWYPRIHLQVVSSEGEGERVVGSPGLEGQLSVPNIIAAFETRISDWGTESQSRRTSYEGRRAYRRSLNTQGLSLLGVDPLARRCSDDGALALINPGEQLRRSSSTPPSSSVILSANSHPPLHHHKRPAVSQPHLQPPHPKDSSYRESGSASGSASGSEPQGTTRFAPSRPDKSKLAAVPAGVVQPMAPAWVKTQRLREASAMPESRDSAASSSGNPAESMAMQSQQPEQLPVSTFASMSDPPQVQQPLANPSSYSRGNFRGDIGHSRRSG